MTDSDTGFRIEYEGGPHHGKRETFPRRPDSVGLGDPNSVYLQTEDVTDDGWRIYRWVSGLQQPIEAEVDSTL